MALGPALERLRGLEREGVVARRELPPPAARQVYELTDDGRDLAGALGPLIVWGAIAAGTIDAAAATTGGGRTVEGDPRAAKRLRRIFSRSSMPARPS